MNYKEAQIVIDRFVKNLCFKFNVFHLYKDLKSVGNLCYLKCKGKFKGGSFRKYFIGALRNELYNFLSKELRYEGLKMEIDDIYSEVQDNLELKLRIAKFIENLNKREKKILELFSDNYNFREISEILGISYERVKDIWSDIKKKAGKIEKSRRDVRRGWFRMNREYIKEYLKYWRQGNSEYFEDWKNRNPEYFKKYFRIKRLTGKRGEIEGYFGKILRIFCSEEKEFGTEKKERCLCVECLLCLDNKCSSIISHTDFLEKSYMERFDFIFLFSQLRALREIKGMEDEIRNQRSFVGKKLIFIGENLTQNFNLIKSSGKRFFMLVKVKK